jgi:hypothetical protein
VVGHWKLFPSKNEAADALSSACLAYGLAQLHGEPLPYPDGAASALPPPLPRRRPTHPILYPAPR